MTDSLLADGPPPVAPGTPPVLQLQGISKYFPGVIANQDVSLDVRPGEIHALLGENGAGKSTLMNVVTGIYQPDAGEIVLDGYGQHFASPQDAIRAGIGMVHQHFKLVPAFTVAENIHLGWRDTPARASAAILESRTRALSDRFGFPVRPDARVGDLSAGEQQRVEILRVLARQARLLILDEPTAVLTPAEARDLFRALRAFRAQGNAVILISHKLDEVMDISDRISILRAGRRIGTYPTAECTPAGLAATMVGRDIVRRDMRARPPGGAAIAPAPVLRLRGVTCRDARGIETLRDVTLDLHGGEILGIAGVAGNGQRELTQVLTGMLPPTAGEILLDGAPVRAADAAAFARAGIGHIPEDRLRSGLAPSLGITDNMALREYDRPPIGRRGLYDPRAAEALARDLAGAAEVRIPDYAMPIRNLSGGNQQRLVARREIRIARRVLVAAYPSRGLDIGAIATVLRYLTDLRDQGVAIVLVSEDLEELLNVADRIGVLFHGRLMATIDAATADMETLGLLMGGRAGRPDSAPQGGTA
ncbi:ABC transporter ATP-binding protein [Gluconacetobacter diazotrophicus]|uniref:ABC transporter ATP-binding protein n=1 Tax=Gluconacetobacter diazotrophicus TaxID=33996 RepID=A0A7W4FCR5_GLUDI|nr:ABC transporter ATP-binding protein [Gluconacetobacter diazotrophicus]MBB2155380.1 ABC transporter ATP-binding protein [Gluconacetobacter diazotrophicus]